MNAGPNLDAGMMVHSGRMVGMHFGVPTLEDIALALSRIPRFGGHCRTPWTVLNHSLVCESIARNGGASKKQRLHVLLHDAHEALTGDVPSPLKVPQIKVLQTQLDARILAEYLPVGLYDNEYIHDIDYRALVAEAVTVGPPGINNSNIVELFGQAPKPGDVKVVERELSHSGGYYEEAAGCYLEASREHFLKRIEELTKD